MKKIAIIGLGYVGLPLAAEFGKIRNVVGFDTNILRVNELKNFNDSTLETSSKELKDAKYLSYTDKLEDIKGCKIFIITVPTPIDSNKNPDLGPLKIASKMISSILKKGDIVIYESTVYPGATEEVCVPLLENGSKLKFNIDFFCGYSPERINPGDKEHRLNNIVKVTSGSNSVIAQEIDELYKEIITVGTFKASSIKVAEAAKVIENTQRDVNIALVNELSIIFNKLDIDTEAVLQAASTKWNFLPFRPGLVGGHCISVDPYYLTHKAIDIGYYPEMILAGRNLNDNMGKYVASQVIELMQNKQINEIDSNALIMGLTFKENCPDLRNTRVIDIANELKNLKCNVDLYDPWVDPNNAYENYGIHMIKSPIIGKYDAIILAVAHNEFKKLTKIVLDTYAKENYVLYDIKYILNANEVDGRL